MRRVKCGHNPVIRLGPARREFDRRKEDTGHFFRDEMPAQLLPDFFTFALLGLSVSPKKRMVNGLRRFHHSLTDHLKYFRLAQLWNQ